MCAPLRHVSCHYDMPHVCVTGTYFMSPLTCVKSLGHVTADNVLSHWDMSHDCATATCLMSLRHVKV